MAIVYTMHMITQEVVKRFLSRVEVAPPEKNFGKQRKEFSDSVQRMLGNLDHNLLLYLVSFDPAELMLIGDFMSKTIKSPAPTEARLESDCWIWIGPKRNKSGYGAYSFFGRAVLCAHRVSYQMFRGYVPGNKVLDHLCRVPSCVNPWHLEIVTSMENVRRGKAPTMIRKLQGLCSNGHPLNFIRPDGRQTCTICRAARLRRWRAEQRKLKDTAHA